ncbi:MAG: GyrI-like domain-containing protein [Chloroflexota bacterium]|jgi:effector-binding domain-containing protein
MTRPADAVPRIAVEELRERHVASIRTTSQAHRSWHTIGVIHELVMDVVGAQGLAPAGPLFARFYQLEPSVDLEAGIPLAQPVEPTGVIRAGVLPGGLALHLLHAGDHAQLPESRSALEAYRVRHGFLALGAHWEFYLVDARDTPDPREWLTDVYLPVVKRSKLVTPRPVGPGRRALSTSGVLC